MKKYFLAFLFVSTVVLSAQETVLFEENFEVHPLTTFKNINSLLANSKSEIPKGVSTCGLASVGNASDYKSTNVDFKESENSTFLLGVNPQNPCGGYYTARVEYSGNIDISSATSPVKFRCRYYKTSTLKWAGQTLLKVTVSDGINESVIESEFSETDIWTELEFDLPATITNSITQIKIDLGGGEGVGIDDVAIAYETVLSIDDSQLQDNAVRVFPNPAGSQLFFTTDRTAMNPQQIIIYDFSGRKVFTQKEINSDASINLSDLAKGLYILDFKIQQQSFRKRIVKK